VCCSVLQCFIMRCNVLQLECVSYVDEATLSVGCRALQCVVVCCSALQHAVVCCSAV